jgi:hypothetical protein
MHVSEQLSDQSYSTVANVFISTVLVHFYSTKGDLLIAVQLWGMRERERERRRIVMDICVKTISKLSNRKWEYEYTPL